MAPPSNSEVALEPWELAVRLEVLFCYPKSDVKGRERIACAVAAKYIQQTRMEDPGLSGFLRRRYPRYGRAALRRKGINFDRRLKAYQVGEVILWFQTLLERSRTDPALAGKPQPSLSGAIRDFLRASNRSSNVDADIADEADEADAVHEFRKRMMEPWSSVSHLAAGFRSLARDLTGEGLGTSFEYWDTPIFAEVLRRADEIKKDFHSFPSANWLANKMHSLDEFDALRR